MPKLVSKYVRPYKLIRSKTGILMIHGFMGTPAEYHYLKEFLKENTDYSLSIPLLSGRGTSVENMSRTSKEDWKRDVFNAYEELSGKCDKIYIIGFSMGGLLSLILASKRPVDKLVLIAPALFTKNRFLGLTKIVQYFLRYTPNKRLDEKFPKEADQYDLKYDIEYDKYPVNKIVDLLNLGKEARSVLGKVKRPIVIIQPKKDDLVNPTSANYIYNHLASKEKDLLWLEKSRHICLLGPEKEIIFKHILEFLKS